MCLFAATLHILKFSFLGILEFGFIKLENQRLTPFLAGRIPPPRENLFQCRASCVFLASSQLLDHSLLFSLGVSVVRLLETALFEFFL